MEFKESMNNKKLNEFEKSVMLHIPLQYFITRLHYAYKFGKNDVWDSVFEGWLDNVVQEAEQFVD